MPRRVRPRATRTTTASVASTGSQGHELDLDTHSTLVIGEQSNTSVVFGDDSAAEDVPPGGRRASTPTSRSTGRSPGPAPTHVAALYGWLEARSTTSPGRDPAARDAPAVPPAPPATAGTLALASVRDLLRRGATCTPTRWAATSPARRTGSATRWPRCTPRSPSAFGPSTRGPAELARARRRDGRPARRGRSTAVPDLERARRRGCAAAFDAVRAHRSAGRTCSASTATCTWARCCARPRAG